MSAHALISGQLFRAPEQRVSKAGKPFVTATIRAKEGEAAQWWKVLAFSESAQAESDVLSVQGQLKADTYETDGVTKLSLSVVADRVLALRQPARKNADAGYAGRREMPMARCRFRRDLRP
jgi:hypothetical protein